MFAYVGSCMGLLKPQTLALADVSHCCLGCLADTAIALTAQVLGKYCSPAQQERWLLPLLQASSSGHVHTLPFKYMVYCTYWGQ